MQDFRAVAGTSRLRSPFTARWDRVLGPIKSPSRGVSQPDDDVKPPKDEDDDGEKARKAKKARGDDDDDEDEQDEKDEDNPKIKAARARERRRIAAIMSSSAAQRDPVTAMHLCVDTSTPRNQAIALLGNLNAAASDRGTSATASSGRDHHGNPLSAAARYMIDVAKGRMGDPKPEGRSDRRGPDLDAQGRPLTPAAQALLDAGRKTRREG